MTTEIKMPSISANEDEVLLAQWLHDSGDMVRRGETICTVETTKATVEVEAEANGYLYHVVGAGTKVATGTVIGTLSANADAPAAPAGSHTEPPATETAPSDKPGRKWTRKAEIVARRAGLEIDEIYTRLGGRTLTESDIQAAIETGAAAPVTTPPTETAAPPNTVAQPSRPARPSTPARTADLLDDAYGEGRPERIALLGGGAGAGAMTVDILFGSRRQRAVAILDNNTDVHGKTVGGVPIVGACDMAEQLWRDGVCDSIMLLITKDRYERAELFGKLSARGVPFTNIIDPTAEIKGGCSLGRGNLIMGRSYLSTGVSIGDNNFLGSHTCIEHHSTVGDHCTFGPRTTTSGAVTIGDRVKTGMSVSIEPYLSVGDDALIASGCMISTDIPALSIVKAQIGHVVRPRDAA